MTGTENLEIVDAIHQWTTFSSDGWSVVKFKNIADGTIFTAVGNSLPDYTECEARLYGTWAKDPKYGMQFKVSFFEEKLPTSEKGIISYFCSLRVGIAKRRAKAIYDKFRETVWDILEHEPERLCEVNGISKKIVDRTVEKITSTRQLRSIMAAFAGYGQITPAKAQKVIDYFKGDALDVVQNHPYRLCEIYSFGFQTVDKMARAKGGTYEDPDRVCAAVLHVLNEAALDGHVCLPMNLLIQRMQNILSDKTHQIDVLTCKAGIRKSFRDQNIRIASDVVFTKSRFEQEGTIAAMVTTMSQQETSIDQIEALIEQYQEETGIKLAEAQADAIRCVFKNTFTVLTGGPGTGKTTTTKAILYVHKLVYGTKSKPVLLAPTGKAARRMSEATEYPATTIHSAIGYHEENEKAVAQDEMLEGNLFIVDEASMMDQMITAMLLEKIPIGAKVVLCGDPDQLPSVGAGNVLKDLIDSKCVPVTKLSVVYRQGKDSPIISNAYAINNGRTDLIFNGVFRFRERTGAEDIFEDSVAFYLKCVEHYGVDEVVLLCPYRSKGDLCVNTLNKRIQELLNPATPDKLVISNHGVKFMEGDKVMQTKNTDIAKNGDVGYIRSITKEPDPEDPTVFTLFANIEWNDDGETHPYQSKMMAGIELAYCQTIHKSQGSEYQNVIMVLSKEHKVMLKRNLIYTGITRAKKHCCLIGEYQALLDGIANDQSDVRFTMLQQRINALAHSEDAAEE